MSDVYQVSNVTLQSGAVANGNGTAMGVGGLSSVGVQVTGMGTATVNFEGTVDDSNWIALQSANLNTGAASTTTTANGIFLVPVSGLSQVRARVSGWSSGTIVVTGKGVVVGSGGLVSSASLAVSQGTAASVAGFWPVRNTDGTNSTPAMDAAARKGFVSVTDGTNTLPTGDAVGRKIFVALTDGTNALLSATAANLSAALPAANSLMVVPAGQWAVYHAPAINTQATISKAAGAAGVRHVCTALTCTLAQNTTGSAQTLLAFNLRDGATGAGTILMSFTLALPATACECRILTLGGLNIFGSTATAMTIESASAPAAQTAASVSLVGYDVG